jgi:hypothetical protein
MKLIILLLLLLLLIGLILYAIECLSFLLRCPVWNPLGIKLYYEM